MTLRAQLASHFIRDDSTERSSADKIWPVRLNIAQFFEVVRRHRVNSFVRRFLAIQASGLQTVKRLVRR